MKRANNLYENMLEYEKALEMFYKIKRNCKNKEAIFRFMMNLNHNIITILMALKNENYKFGKYRIFMIKDPKYRIVMSENIPDKLVNHLVSKYILLPALEPKLIDTNIATRIGKGSSYGFETFISYVKKLQPRKEEIYVLKIDISKYFYNIDHEILMELLRKYIKEEKTLRLLKIIIDTSDEEYVNKFVNHIKKLNIDKIRASNLSRKEKEIKIAQIESLPTYQKGKGLPIGNMTSQILAIFYMNDVDHFIKEKLKAKYYIRYMDDLLILDTDKEKLKKYFELIKVEIEKLKLTVNKKSNIFTMSHGVGFLGYVFKLKNGKIMIRYNNQTIRRITRKLKKLKDHDFDKFKKSKGSYFGYLKMSNTNLIDKDTYLIDDEFYVK